MSPVFEPCSGLVDATTYYETCIKDMCDRSGDLDAMESVIECIVLWKILIFSVQAVIEYARRCKRAGSEFCDWRERAGISQMSCSSDSTYNSCGNPCEGTCNDFYASDRYWV